MATSNIAIKITALPNIGNNIAPTTLIPVVNMSGVPTTQKANLQITGNLILAGAGTANFVPAGLANLAYNVVNSNQANITRLGTLNINTFKVSGGLNGQYIQTDGTGNLAWVSGGGSGNGVVGGANTQIQYNNAGNFGGSSGLTWNGSTGVLSTLNLSVSSGATIYGNTALTNLNVAGNLTSNNIFTDNYYYANGYVFSGGGNGTPGGSNTQVQFNNNGVFGGNTGFTFNNTTGIFAALFLAGNGNGLSNIQGANVSGFVANANVANTAFSVAAANVSGLGNIATINLTGSNSNVLYGNGVFAAVAGGANTGNVTFDDVTVQGVNQLNLSAGADFTANLAYLQVRSGDVASHIHLDTGNNTAYDLIVGDDAKFVQVSSTGNIIMSSYDGNTSHTMTLDTTGNLIFPRDAAGNIDPILTIVSGATPTIVSTDASLTGPANLAIQSNYLNLSGFSGSKVIFYPDVGEITTDGSMTLTTNNANVGNTKSWTLDGTGSLSLATISLGVGLDEATVVQSQRKIIPSFRYSAVISGTTPTVVYTANDVNTTSMKVTIQIQHTGLGMEFFEVYATYANPTTYYTVSNRVAAPAISNSTVVVDLNGSNTMQITITVNSGAATSWVTYDSTEFGIPQD